MAKQWLIPGSGFIDSSGLGNEYLIPGVGFVCEELEATGVDVLATCASLNLTENAATVILAVEINISAGIDELNLTEYAADVNLNVVVNASYDYLSLNSFYAAVSNLPHNVIATDWLKYKGECHEWIDGFQEQAPKWGYLNNPNWTTTPADPIEYNANPEDEPVVWRMTKRRF